MTDFNQFHDSLNPGIPPPPQKTPDMLNVLTILTFIGCAIFGLIGPIYNYFSICHSVEVMQQLSNTDNPMAGFMNSMSESAIKQCEMRLPILIISLATTLLCFLGALQMRKLKKTGFFLYVIGEIALPVGAVILTGSSGMMTILGFVFPVIFIILYATQLKHLK